MALFQLLFSILAFVRFFAIDLPLQITVALGRFCGTVLSFFAICTIATWLTIAELCRAAVRAVHARSAALLRSSFDAISACLSATWMTIAELCRAAARAVLDTVSARLSGLVAILTDLPETIRLSLLSPLFALLRSAFDAVSVRLRGLAGLPREAVRKIQLDLVFEVADWRSIARSPNEARALIEELQASMTALLDDRDAAVAAWRATAHELSAAAERNVELEGELMRVMPVVDEAQAVLRFASERQIIAGEASGSPEEIAPIALAEQSPVVRRAGPIERRVGLTCALE